MNHWRRASMTVWAIGIPLVLAQSSCGSSYVSEPPLTPEPGSWDEREAEIDRDRTAEREWEISEATSAAIAEEGYYEALGAGDSWRATKEAEDRLREIIREELDAAGDRP